MRGSKRPAAVRACFVALVLIVVAGAGVEAAPATGTAGDVVEGTLGERLDAYLSGITPFGFSGAVLVAEDGRIVLNKGYGEAIKEQDVPNTTETAFSLGSITKQFTAAAIMALEMDGRLNTSDPIRLYLPDVPEDKAEITIDQLLTHSAGLTPGTMFSGPGTGVTDHDTRVAEILAEPLRFAPGTDSEYCNACFTLAAAIIEHVSGEPYEQFLERRLFQPAGMHSTGMRLPDQVIAYNYNGEVASPPAPADAPLDWRHVGAGDILSTTEDMYRWHQAMLDDRVLNEAARGKLFTPGAYSWDVVDTPHGLLIEHSGGSTNGNTAELRRYMDAGVVTMVFANQSHLGTSMIAAMRDSLEDLIFGGDVAMPPAVEHRASDALQEYAGTYAGPEGGSLSATVQDDALMITAAGQDAVNLLAFPGESDLTRYTDLNARSEKIVEAALHGDWSVLESAASSAEVAGSARQSLASLLGAPVALDGAGGDAQAVSTTPFIDNRRGPGEGTAVATLVRVGTAPRAPGIEVIWSGDRVVGVQVPAGPPQPVRRTFQPVAGTEFVSYDIGTGETARLTFVLDDRGAVVGIRPTGDSTVFLPRDNG